MCEGLSKASIKAEQPIHCLVTRSTAYGQACDSMFLAPALRCFCQFSRNALATEGRFDIKILIYARVCAGERRVVCSNAAHAHGAIAVFGDKKRDAPLFDGLLEPFLLGTCKHVFADLKACSPFFVYALFSSFRSCQSSGSSKTSTVNGTGSAGGRSISGSPHSSAPFSTKPTRFQNRRRRSSPP